MSKLRKTKRQRERAISIKEKKKNKEYREKIDKIKKYSDIQMGINLGITALAACCLIGNTSVENETIKIWINIFIILLGAIFIISNGIYKKLCKKIMET